MDLMLPGTTIPNGWETHVDNNSRIAKDFQILKAMRNIFIIFLYAITVNLLHSQAVLELAI
jgi:hypothetical protein